MVLVSLVYMFFFSPLAGYIIIIKNQVTFPSCPGIKYFAQIKHCASSDRSH